MQTEDTALLLNSRPTLLHLPPLLIVHKDTAGHERCETGECVSLQPGSLQRPVGTTVPRAEWERAKQHKVVKDWIRLGWVSEAAADKAAEIPTEAPPPLDLMNYSPEGALALIETEDRADVLRQWHRPESRQPVKEALEKRLRTFASKAPIVAAAKK